MVPRAMLLRRRSRLRFRSSSTCSQGGRRKMPSRLLRVLALLLIATATRAVASGARWVTGQPYYYPEGNTIVWYTDSPQYFTDSGDLSAYVDNAAANAIVAA